MRSIYVRIPIFTTYGSIIPREKFRRFLRSRSTKVLFYYAKGADRARRNTRGNAGENKEYKDFRIFTTYNKSR